MVLDPCLSRICVGDLVGYMQQYQPATPLIICTTQDMPETKELLLSYNNVLCYFSEPCQEDELLAAVQKGVARYRQNEGIAFSGQLLAVSLRQLAAHCQSCRLEVVSPDGEQGFIFCHEGQVLHGFLGELQGEEAVRAMLAWPHVSMRLHNLPVGGSQRTIYVDLTDLLSPAGQDSSEPPSRLAAGQAPEKTGKSTQQEQGAKICPTGKSAPAKPKSTVTAVFTKAISQAQANQENKARVLIGALLKKNPKNGFYWLWFSRLATDMKIVKKALSNASLLLPANPEVINDGRKVKASLLAGCPAEGEVWHCPFCWAPVALETRVCTYCKGQLFIYQGVLAKIGRANRQIMKDAQVRYIKVVANSNGCRSHYNLALVYLNMGRFDTALSVMQQAVECDPDNLFFAGQLHDFRELMNDGASGDESVGLEGYDGAGVVMVDKQRVLVVEDSNTTRKAVCLMLKKAGYDVLEASDGMSALSICKEQVPDLILLDLIMPIMDGYQVLDAVKKDSALRKVPVIMLTARSSLLDKVKGRLSASEEYLTKPFKSPELLAKVKKYL